MQWQKRDHLIISADDFGVSKKANEAILEVAQKGKIDRVAVMVGGEISEEEIKEILKTKVKLDIHLHLLDKEFFQNRKGEPSRKTIQRSIIFLTYFLTGKYSSRKVGFIWKKQIEGFYKMFKRYPDGINSHEHLHFFPPFFKVALKLKKEFSITYLRLGKKESGLKFNAVAFILNTLRKINLKFNRTIKLNISDYLISFDWLEEQKNFLENLPKKEKTEIVFHPERKEERQFLLENF
ncbi:MAG TPA: ChbG/HpnK family deacetylase [Candidatus Moranbacteria bacterium]|nr:ChbG/HpnK family deacetylase [Candidatus Moranbacteria bacterium]